MKLIWLQLLRAAVTSTTPWEALDGRDVWSLSSGHSGSEISVAALLVPLMSASGLCVQLVGHHPTLASLITWLCLHMASSSVCVSPLVRTPVTWELGPPTPV